MKASVELRFDAQLCLLLYLTHLTQKLQGRNQFCLGDERSDSLRSSYCSTSAHVLYIVK